MCVIVRAACVQLTATRRTRDDRQKQGAHGDIRGGSHRRRRRAPLQVQAAAEDGDLPDPAQALLDRAAELIHICDVHNGASGLLLA